MATTPDAIDSELAAIFASIKSSSPNPYGLKRKSNLSRDTYHRAEADDRPLPGTILPAGSQEGTSAGFDATRPLKIRVDPSQLGDGGFMLDLSQVTEEEHAKASSIATKQFPDDLRARGLAAYKIMAKLLHDRQTGAVKLAASPVVIPTTNSKIADLLSREKEEPAMPVQSRRVDFDLPRPIGELTCHYHDVFWTAEALFLVCRQDAAGMKWFPPPPDEEAVEEPSPILLLVYDKDNQRQAAFRAVPSGLRFSYLGLDFCVLAIEEARNLQEELSMTKVPTGDFEKRAVISAQDTPLMTTRRNSSQEGKKAAGEPTLDELTDDPVSRLDASAERIFGK